MKSRKQLLLTAPAVAVSILPSLTCPLCWPAYAAVLSSIGAGFLMSSAYLLPVTAALLAAALAGLGVQARQHGGYGPLLLGLLSSALIMAGNFAFASAVGTYAGAALLVGASVWGLLLRRPAAGPTCPSCTAADSGR